VRELGEVKGTPGMVHLRDVAAKRMARRFDPKGSAHMKFYYEFDKLPIARRASRG
jgi:hypothetical protein